MSSTKIICFLLVLNVSSIFATKCECPVSPCEEYSLRDTVAALWDLPSRSTHLIDKYRDLVTDMLFTCNTRELALLTSQSLWAVDVLTDISTDIHPTCVFGKLINATLASQQDDCSGAKEEMNKALIKYKKLCGNAIDFSVYLGLVAAGCPAEYPTMEKYPIEGQPCAFGDTIELYLESGDSEIPAHLLKIIRKMLKSKNQLNVSVAYALIGASSSASVDYFEYLFKTDELLEVLRFKSCNVPVPRRCCHLRKKELIQRCELLRYRCYSNIDILTNYA